ncbi:MAG: type IX secretion system membrane protein PorP/SprF [Bacteroidetes bacterium]|nr:type IX secretion system membrane protein PorP/SprF [Bacteroidota bacterium]
MKRILTTIVLSVTILVTFAQQDAQFSMNMFNRLQINPGYAGTNQALCGTILYRDQWDRFGGAPKTGLLSVDYGRIFGGGLGITIDQDELGFDKTLKAKLAYSYHLSFGTGTLGIGIDAGMIQKSIKGDFIAPDGSTSQQPGNDLSIPWDGTAATTYDLGFGLYYTNPRLYVGLSSLHLPEQSIKQTGSLYDFNYKVARHYYVMAGYKFIVGNQLSITPSVLAKSDASSTQLDINLLGKWNNLIFLGVSYRLTDAIVGIVGLERDLNPKMSAKLGYSYDVTTSAIKNHSNGTHEIMLGFCYKIKKEPKPTSHMNVRFL